MTLPITGRISLGDIQTEYGGNTPVRFGDYYESGPLVTSDSKNTIPISGSIRTSNFYGAEKNVILNQSLTTSNYILYTGGGFGGPSVPYLLMTGYQISLFGSLSPRTLPNGIIIDAIYNMFNYSTSAFSRTNVIFGPGSYVPPIVTVKINAFSNITYIYNTTNAAGQKSYYNTSTPLQISNGQTFNVSFV